MKRLALLSDTHGDARTLLNAESTFRSCDAIIHLGDGVRDAEVLASVLGKPFLAVRGNNDWDSDLPLVITPVFEGVRLFCTHGHTLHVKSGLLPLDYAAAEHDAPVALFGHTHRAEAVWGSRTYLVNPGSLSALAWEKPTMAVLTLDKGTFHAEILNVGDTV